MKRTNNFPAKVVKKSQIKQFENKALNFVITNYDVATNLFSQVRF